MKNFIITLIAVTAGFLTNIPQSAAGDINRKYFKGLQQDSLVISMPVPRIVYQRNTDNWGIVPVRGATPAGASRIEARLVSRSALQGQTTSWKRIATTDSQTFSGTLKARGGWYDLEVRAYSDKEITATATISRVGIGEVFIVVGHSVAHGGEINIEGATDDRVSTVQVHEYSDMNQKYLKTGDPQFLPEPHFVHAGDSVAPAPFAHNTYFWSKFAELVVQKENVPVLIFNSAFGGTSLEHWAKASQGVQFEHGFVKSGIRMPYINLYNTFKKYIALTGVRALLADHAQNDWPQKNTDTILNNYRIFIRQARADLGHPQLALVVNRQTPKNSPHVRFVQERMSQEQHAFPGADYDKLGKDDTVDGIHLSASGARKAATMWAAALTPRFFNKAQPWHPVWK